MAAALLCAAIPLIAETPRPAPASKPGAAAPAAAASAQKAEEPVIPGFPITRTKGGFLSLAVENGNFRLSFYDTSKQPVSADVSRANVRWIVHYTVYDQRTVLNPTPDGMALTSSTYIRPPYQFKLYLTLIVDGSSEAPETYAIDFRQ